MEYDIFISHASEDKEDVARPLATHLKQLGLSVWIDEFELTLGDSLRRSIDKGLSQSKFGAVILSQAFFSKEWPNKELDALVAREDGSEKAILPIWHNVGKSEVLQYAPLLADKLAVTTSGGIANIANQINGAVTQSRTESGSLHLKIVPTESEVLERIRKDMITADSSRELQRAIYELEEYSSRDPHSPAVRLLHDNLSEALNRTKIYEMKKKVDYKDSIGCINKIYLSRKSYFGLLLLTLLALCYGLYLLFKWFF